MAENSGAEKVFDTFTIKPDMVELLRDDGCNYT